MLAELIEQVASGVQTPLDETLQPGLITTGKVRLDISANGFWLTHEMTYFEVKVFNPYARTKI